MSTVRDLIESQIGSIRPFPKDCGFKIEPKLLNDSIQVVDKDTFIGLEVEVERVETSSSLGNTIEGSLWTNTEDGSLRNNGREFVSLPIRGDLIPASINFLRNFLEQSPSTRGYEFSDRTSVHVHMNVQDCTVDELLSLLYLYTLVEPILYEYAGRARFDSIFCVPITESHLDNRLVKVINELKKPKSNSVIEHINSWMKYTGLNLLPLLRYGTIEFRHLNGTLDNKRLMTWINLLLSLRKFVRGVSSEKLLSRILEMNTNSEYSHFLQEVFGELYHTFDFTNLQSMLEPSVTFLKDIHHTIKVSSLINIEEYATKPDSSSLMSLLNKKGFAVFVNVEDKVKSYKEHIIGLEDNIIKLQAQIDIEKKEISKAGKQTDSQARFIAKTAKDIQSYARIVKDYTKAIVDLEKDKLKDFNTHTILFKGNESDEEKPRRVLETLDLSELQAESIPNPLRGFDDRAQAEMARVTRESTARFIRDPRTLAGDWTATVTNRNIRVPRPTIPDVDF